MKLENNKKERKKKKKKKEKKWSCMPRLEPPASFSCSAVFRLRYCVVY